MRGSLTLSEGLSGERGIVVERMKRAQTEMRHDASMGFGYFARRLRTRYREAVALVYDTKCCRYLRRCLAGL